MTRRPALGRAWRSPLLALGLAAQPAGCAEGPLELDLDGEAGDNAPGDGDGDPGDGDPGDGDPGDGDPGDGDGDPWTPNPLPDMGGDGGEDMGQDGRGSKGGEEIVACALPDLSNCGLLTRDQCEALGGFDACFGGSHSVVCVHEDTLETVCSLPVEPCPDGMTDACEYL